MPVKALGNFRVDIARARAIFTHTSHPDVAANLPLRDDLLRSAWMFSVGAMDAYFCDAYADLVTATLSSKARQRGLVLPGFIEEFRVASRLVFRHGDSNWLWRNAAHEMMQTESVLSLEHIQQLFNPFLKRTGVPFFSRLLESWVRHPESDYRLFGALPSDFDRSDDRGKSELTRAALDRMEKQFAKIFQRRHDCIHSCDRPRNKPKPFSSRLEVARVLADVEFVVLRCDENLEGGFRRFLEALGCTPGTMRSAGYPKI